MNKYIITDIPFVSDKDKKLFLFIVKKTMKSWKGGEHTNTFLPIDNFSSIICLYVENEKLMYHRNSEFFNGDFKKIHYRDFLKDKKISTKEFLGCV